MFLVLGIIFICDFAAFKEQFKNNWSILFKERIMANFYKELKVFKILFV